MTSLTVVVAVSRDPSDIYFANQLARRLKAVGVLVERQVPEPDRTPRIQKALRLAGEPRELLRRISESLVNRYRNAFAVYNQPRNFTDFGPEGLSLAVPENCDVIYTTGANRINASEYIAWLRSKQPDVVVVCGTSLLREEFLAIPARCVLNLHGGLSQRYRGLNPTDWAVHNDEPEYVGATVHLVTAGIDNGEIVYQGRPEIERNDTPNSLYVKVVKLGVDMMEAAVRDLAAGAFRIVKPTSQGHLYLGKEFTHNMRLTTWKRCAQGVVSRFVDDPVERSRRVDEVIVNDFRNASRQTRPSN